MPREYTIRFFDGVEQTIDAYSFSEAKTLLGQLNNVAHWEDGFYLSTAYDSQGHAIGSLERWT